MDRIKTAVSMFNAGAVLCEEFDKLNKGTEDIKARRRSLIIPIVIVYIFGHSTRQHLMGGKKWGMTE